MNRWQDSLKTGMDLLSALVFIGMSDMLRGIVAPELEKRLGRKLTDLEWEFYLQESYRKAKMEYWQKTVRQWRQWLVDRKIIQDFVWNEGEG
ncbi:MAG: hypothetical protein V1850_01500 [Candidatus Bathyarchaeota archaeon]